MSLPVPPRPDVGVARDDDAPAVGHDGARGRPKATWSGLEGVGIWLLANVVVGGLLLYSIFASFLDLDDVEGGADADVLLVSAVIAVVTVALLWLWLRTRHPSWRAVMGLDAGRDGLRDAAWGAAAGLVLYPIVALGVGLIVVVVLEAFATGPVDTPDQLAPDLSGAGTVLAVLYGFVIAPIAEEFFFRGVLFRGIADRRGFWPAAVISGLVFGLVHLPVGEPLVDALVLPIVMTFAGIGLAWIYERRQSLLAPIAAHMVFNAIGLVLILSGVGG